MKGVSWQKERSRIIKVSLAIAVPGEGFETCLGKLEDEEQQQQQGKKQDGESRMKEISLLLYG